MQLVLDSAEFHPGEVVTGRVQSSVGAEVDLGWYLEGAVSCYTKLVERVVAVPEFKLQLPHEPYSYDGVNFKIVWLVECRAGSHFESREIVVLPR